MPQPSESEKFEFMKSLYVKRMDAMITTMSLRVIYELTRAFDVPMTEFCQYISNDNKFNVI